MSHFQRVVVLLVLCVVILGGYSVRNAAHLAALEEADLQFWEEQEEASRQLTATRSLMREPVVAIP